MPKFFSPADEPADWQRLLAKPDLHWKTGHSAKSIAYSWTEAQGFPSEVRAVLDESSADRNFNARIALRLVEE